MRFDIFDCGNKPPYGFVVEFQDVKSQALSGFWPNTWQSLKLRYQSGKRTCVRGQAELSLAKSRKVETRDIWHQLALLFIAHVFSSVDGTVDGSQDQLLQRLDIIRIDSIFADGQ